MFGLEGALEELDVVTERLDYARREVTAGTATQATINCFVSRDLHEKVSTITYRLFVLLLTNV